MEIYNKKRELDLLHVVHVHAAYKMKGVVWIKLTD